MKLKIPNILTIGRIIIVPIFVVTFFIPGFFGDLIPFFLFVLASFTDYLDGLLARLFKEESKLGELLDPIADKILVLFLFVGLAINLSSYLIGLFASIIITREIWVGALRDLNARNRKSDATQVTFLAKIKTSIQLLTISIYLFALAMDQMLLVVIGDIFLVMSAIITLYTGYIYTIKTFKT